MGTLRLEINVITQISSTITSIKTVRHGLARASSYTSQLASKLPLSIMGTGDRYCTCQALPRATLTAVSKRTRITFASGTNELFVVFESINNYVHKHLPFVLWSPLSPFVHMAYTFRWPVIAASHENCILVRTLSHSDRLEVSFCNNGLPERLHSYCDSSKTLSQILL